MINTLKFKKFKKYPFHLLFKQISLHFGLNVNTIYEVIC